MWYGKIDYCSFLAILFTSLLSLSSCVKKSSQGNQEHSVFEPIPSPSKFEIASEKGSTFSLLLGSTQNFDIPVPVTFSLVSSSTEEQEKQARDLIKYQGSLSVKQTVDFYLREMERTGWDIANLSINNEGFLYCKKPTKLCGIMIQSGEKNKSTNSTEISLFLTHK